MEERRAHPRTPFQGKVDCSGNVRANALDISLSGISIVCNKNLQEGTVMFLMISLNHKGILKIIGRVAWITHVDCEQYKCGIEFFALNEYEQRKIQEFVNETFIDN